MNYTILKTIIETSLNQYSCQNCQQKPDENSISIEQVNEWAVDFMVTCPHCKAEAQMHAEIGSAQLNTLPNNNSIWIKKHISTRKNTNAIQESDIADIEKNLTEKISIEDLLK